MKVSELSGAQLDYWVARAEGYGPSDDEVFVHIDGRCRIAYHKDDDPDSLYQPSTEWSWGGPIIEREGIATYRYDEWVALVRPDVFPSGSLMANIVESGATLLVAAMRAYVGSKFGDEVPDEASDAPALTDPENG